ncbi:exonuclease V, subunit [Candidatus Blochmanniella floridana]|uniref:RecBCD enzyme subunit RecC n=1 Tax=Blochmanniella floridana TaxID=203907 RepID=Q7VRF1_BLOFL|nr:exonuclease V, subunit [Candidatus Blochmannia floridanus]
MFMVYHSNCLDLFMRLVINVMSNQKLSNPMKPEIILIEHKIMSQWIEIELTNYFGISANIIFMTIQSFIRKISIELLSDGIFISNFSKNFMYWKFMEILPKLYSSQKCAVIQKYLCFDVNQKKLGQLSEQLVSLFLEYLIYRPDWLDMWKSNKIIDNLNIEHQLWQSEVWRMFLTHTQLQLYEFNSENRCIFLLQNNYQQIDWTKLPDRIFIYGVTAIAPIYWKILKLLSDHIDIYLWVINPCEKYWNNTDYMDDINKHVYHQSNNHSWEVRKKYYYNNRCNKSILKSNYSLLNSWGEVGFHTLHLLSQLERPLFEIQSFVFPKTNSMLHILQNEILQFKQYSSNEVQKESSIFKKSANMQKNILKSTDQSITIHECHSLYREIEVLHDNLLRMFSNDSALLPGEVIVMAPNINCYTESIKSIFNNMFNRQLPFSILSDHSDYIHHPIISTILNILAIPTSRFTVEEIFSLLSIPSIASKFSIDDEAMKLLRLWIVESGVRWGLDQDTQENFNLPVTEWNTWYFGFKRMLLGYAIKNQNGSWKNIFPYNYISEEYVHVVSGLGEFLEILKKWRNRLNGAYTLQKWMLYFREMINDFFDFSKLNVEENQALFLLKNCWTNILESGIQLGYINTVTINILRDKLLIQLMNQKKNYQFLPNAINFCNITPMCFISCKILCIIGIHDNEFPRDRFSYDFNLISKRFRIGDNNICGQDYYAFLLACLLPKEKLYLSFINKLAFCYGNSISSSIFIDELIEYIAQRFYLIGDQNLDIISNIKRIRKYLLYKYSCMPFSCSNFIAYSKKQSFANEWLAAAYADKNITVFTQSQQQFLTTSLPHIIVSTILLRDLYDFYRHPVRMWFQKRLKVYFYQCTHDILLNDETFFVSNLRRFQLNVKLIDYFIHNKNIDTLYREFYDSGMLPYGSFGQLYWIEQCEKMYKLASKIKRYYSSKIFTLNITFKIETIKLIGELHSVQENGLIRWKPAYLSMRDCFLVWLEHLIYCFSGGNGESWLFGTDSTWHFPNFSKIQAQELLFFLISGYCLGINVPLLLLYKSGGAWINYVFDWNNRVICSDPDIHKKACQRLIYTWQGSSDDTQFSYLRESQDPYLRKLIPLYLNEEDIRIITDVSKDYLLDLMRYRIL